jgi:hypothetical protein
MQSKLYELPSPRLTRGEYWLMETMVKYRIPAGFLGRDDLGMIFNKQPHGLSQDELLATVSELSRQGLVSYTVRHDETERQFSSTDQIRAALAEKFRPGKAKTYLRLTSEGARVWEAFAAPRWDEYISDTYGFDESLGKETEELICPNLSRLQRFFKSRYPWLYQIETMQVRWDKLEPWQATYWKTFPTAHRVRFVVPDERKKSVPRPPQYVSPPRWCRWD